MDFSLYEPPPNAKTENAGITVDDQPPEVVSAGSTFRYFGPSNLFLNNMLFVALITVVFLAAKGTPDEFRIVIASGVFLGLSALFALWNWVDVTADSDKLVVREYIWRRPRDIRYGEINSVKIYAEKDRGSVTRFLGFNLKRGKNFDLALPDKRQAELLMFVKTRLRK
jgi:hypothetical protein